MLQDTFRTEHLLISVAVELHFLRSVRLAVLYSADFNWRRGLRLLVGLHRESCQHLVVDWQVVRLNLVGRLVVRAQDYTVLRKFPATLEAEGVATGQRQRLLVDVIVGLEADAAFEDRFHLAQLKL